MPPYLQFFDSDGQPRNGGYVYTYAAGTTTPKATFTTALGDVQAANPVLLNASGLPDHGSGNIGTIWIQGSYDFLITNLDGTDPVPMEDVTSFNTISAAGASYSEVLSGNGTQVTFTLAQNLGTDENAIQVFVDNGLFTFIKNGDFATDTEWTKGTGWTISGGVANAGGISTAITQNALPTINQGQSYTISYTITAVAGSLTPSIGGTAGTARTTSGTYTETIIAGATQVIAFTGASFNGTLDNVAVRNVEGIGRQLVLPSEYTLNGTSLTFAIAPKTGTGNIFVSAPSSLVASASASAAAAESFALAANVSAIAAAASATSLLGTSTTSVLIGTGSKAFTTQTGKNFATGEFITIASNAGPTNYMFGQVTSYDTLTGALVVNVTSTGGSGTFADWNIAVSGIQGPAGIISPADGSVTYPKLAAALIATTADVTAGTASKVPDAAALAPLYFGTRVAQTAGQALTTGALRTLAFNTETYDDGGWHDNVTNNSRITVDFTGRVQLIGSVGGLPTSGNDKLELHRNGTLIPNSMAGMTSVGGAPPNVYSSTIMDEVSCTSGDYFEFKITVSSNWTTNIDYTRFIARRLK